MKVCILGNGLTSLTLAKILVNQGINVDIFSDQIKKKYNKIQTIGISKSNVDFFNNHILNIEKLIWNIKKIEIFKENLPNEKILHFENNNTELFSLIRNYELYDILFSYLKKNKLIRFKKKVNYDKLKNESYKIIFNCDSSNTISKKFFHKKINKNYNSFAFTTMIKHKKLSNNHTATQIFTKKGPIAFLPVSSTETSVVYSVRGSNDLELEYLIKKYNDKFKILRINKIFKFKLELSYLRTYYYKNILAFGDLLHRLHPLAGQGFNMTIRDIKEIYKLIEFRINHGLDLDTSICSDFEEKTQSKNYLFSTGIDFIYEFFNLESKLETNSLSKSVKFLGKNKMINNFFTKVADKGIEI